MRLIIFILFLTSLSVYAHQKCDFPILAEQKFIKKSNHVMSEAFERQTMQQMLITQSGKFAIHYDVQGFNAVNTIDSDNNGIPDYIDSTAYYIDAAYEDEVNKLGFPFFHTDNNAGGTEVYDIYVKELKQTPYYGGTQPEDYITNKDGEKYYTSYIIIDNNFSKDDKKYRTTDIDGLKITLYHEFHHSIQLQMVNDFNNIVIAEMTSTFMEFRFFPEITDYIQWSSKWFEEPTVYSLTNEISPEKGYGLSIFFQYTYKMFGDGLMLNLWNDLAKKVNKIDAMNNMLIAKNSNLSMAFCDFTEWMYSTGSNSVGDSYFLHAQELPELNLTDEIQFNGDDIVINQGIKPFSFSPYRVIFQNNSSTTNDTLVLLLNNVDYDNARIGQSIPSDIDFVLQSNQSQNSKKVDGLDVYYTDNSDFVFCNNLIVLKGQQGERFAEPFPNPYYPERHSVLYIPVPDNTEVYEKVNIEIYTTDMNVLSVKKKEVLIYQGKYVVALQQSELPNLNNGVYLFKSYNDEESKVGKILVKK